MKITYRFRGENRKIDDEVRKSAPGHFVALSDGFTHYEFIGPRVGTATVLVHGFSAPYFIWDPTSEALASSGIRTLRYDLYGRGYSDRPDVTYNQACYDRQFIELLEALHLEPPINLIGLSMGGAITVGITDRHPELIQKLVLIDPAGLPVRQSPLFSILKVPYLGEWVFDHLAEKLLVAGLAKDLHTRDKLKDFENLYRSQMQYAGFKRALLSTLRYGPLQKMESAYQRVGLHSRPLLLIWGTEDRTVPFELSRAVRRLLPNAEFHAIEGAGHIPHYEMPCLVNPLVIRFLSEDSSRR